MSFSCEKDWSNAFLTARRICRKYCIRASKKKLIMRELRGEKKFQKYCSGWDNEIGLLKEESHCRSPCIISADGETCVSSITWLGSFNKGWPRMMESSKKEESRSEEQPTATGRGLVMQLMIRDRLRSQVSLSAALLFLHDPTSTSYTYCMDGSTVFLSHCSNRNSFLKCVALRGTWLRNVTIEWGAPDSSALFLLK